MLNPKVAQRSATAPLPLFRLPLSAHAFSAKINSTSTRQHCYFEQDTVLQSQLKHMDSTLADPPSSMFRRFQQAHAWTEIGTRQHTNHFRTSSVSLKSR